MIAAAFPGMFTWPELIDMGMRQRGYWLRQLDALRRQNIAMVAYGVGAGISMAFSEKGQETLDGLELTETLEDIQEQKSKANWDMLKCMGRGTGS